MARGEYILLISLILVATQVIAQHKSIKSPKAIRPRTPSQGSSYINIPDPKATTVKISFGYVNGAKKFKVYAKEWIDDEREQIIPTDEQTKSEHIRTAVLSNLIPGRKYLIQVQAYDRFNRKIGRISELVVRTSQRCYVCNAVGSNGECIGQSNQMECVHNHDGCLNELRYANGVPTLTKRCAQYRPELGRTVQNGRNVLNACGGLEVRRDAFCKCMCKSDLCNKREMPCVDECFDELPIPPGAYLNCTNGNKIGSVCKYRCRGSMQIKGIDTSKCRLDRTWSLLSPPACIGFGPRDVEYTCPVLEPTENSEVTCTKENKPGSICTFKCLNGFKLSGSVTRQCSTLGKWSGLEVTCGEVLCPALRIVPNVGYECSKGRSVGSVCEMFCKNNLQISGASELVCQKQGRWSDSMPQCVEPDCARLPDVNPNVLMTCTPMRERVGRTCEFSCEEGYNREGATRSTCYKGNRWTQKSPICRRKQCPTTGTTKPENGFVRCTSRNYFGSSCTFTCPTGYLLEGNAAIECLSTGFWSGHKPKCTKVACPSLSRFQNGNMVCNGGNAFGSICSISCMTGYGLPPGAATRVQCIVKNPAVEYDPTQTSSTSTGAWNYPIRQCTRVRCPSLGPDPKNSIVKCNRVDKQVLGVTCTYDCKPGYSRVGLSRLSCVRRTGGSSVGTWTGALPTCERNVCPVVPAVDMGEVKCTEDNYSGSKCVVNCFRGYRLEGNQNPSCTMNGFWTTRFPVCARIECTSKPFLLNGFFDCDQVPSYYMDDFCKANCKQGYKLSREGGANCGPDGEWMTPLEMICEEKNECKDNTHECDHICVNTPGSYICKCKKGYVLMENGRNCKINVCPVLNDVDNGKISCSEENWVIGTICALSCQNGYEPNGNAVATCTEGGKWSKEIDRCQRIQCPFIKAPLNGLMSCSNDNKFASLCDFVCNDGYELIGTDAVRCEADENWSHDVPKCRKIECPIVFTSLINGLAICSEFNLYQSVCKYSCNRGYRFEDSNRGSLGIRTAECDASGKWNKDKPKCIRKNCIPSIKSIRSSRLNGKVTCTNADFFGSTCTITCEKGFQVEGPYRSNCAGDAEWDKELGTCEKISCPAFLELSNGVTTCTDEYRYQSTCKFVCNEGYKLVGESNSECQADRSWTEKKPICQRRICPQSHLDMDFGTSECTDGFYFDSICSFRCDSGYEFADETSTTVGKKQQRIGSGISQKTVITAQCLVIGWSREKPMCVRHRCAPPSATLEKQRPNGSMKCTNGDYYQSTCNLKCEKGYEIQKGSDEIMCTDDRSWSPSLGYCESSRKITCPVSHLNLKNGNATCSDANRYMSECLYFCDPGFTMEFTGDVVRHATYGNVAVLTCLADRTWGGKLPVCTRKQCSVEDGGIVRAKLNGDVFCSESFWFGSVCTVKCHKGYQLVGPSSTRCNSNADWSPPIGYCIKVQCGPLKVPTNGDMSCTDEFKYESICSFTCDFGFELRGWEQSVCTAERYFTNTPPFCREIFCPNDFLKIASGTVTCSNSNKYASRCEYECDEGWQLTKSSVDVANCQANYKWDATAKPKCERKQCPKSEPALLKAAVNGEVTCTAGNMFESICTVTCDEGYELVNGAKLTECKADQTWGPSLGHCVKISCPEWTPLENGLIECTDGLRFQSECSFSCESGYDKIGADSSICKADRTFSKPKPNCIKIKCPINFLSIENAKVKCSDDNYFDSICTYTCQNGYERSSGSLTVQCLPDRTWDAEKAVCVKKVCNKDADMLVKARENGVLVCTDDYNFASVCKLNCNIGYELIKIPGDVDGKTKCNSDGKWEYNVGYCTKVQCSALSAPLNGTIKCSEENRYKSECQFTCDEGFEMEGLPLTECQDNRKWTVSKPTCQKIKCPTTHLSLINGNSKCTNGNRYLSVCEFKCDTGYESQDGDIMKTQCKSTRAWSSEPPTCSKKVCDPEDKALIRAKTHGQVVCTDGAKFESVCALLCDNGWQLSEGVGRTVCGADTNWIGQIGYCERITCDALNVPENAEMTCTNAFRFESVCSFKCDPGFEMIGFDSSSCLSTGSFSNKPPKCKKIQCSKDYLRLPFGFANCTDRNLFQSVCTYSCQRGYRMVGGGITGSDVRYVSSKCSDDRSWSLEIPMCEKKTCPYDSDEMLRALEHGELTCTEGNRYLSQCTLVCDKGYELSGEETYTCMENGQWNLPIGYCIKKRCPKYNVPPNTDVQCSDGTFYNSTCILSCNIGYTFEDEELAKLNMLTTRCSSTAVWTLPEPQPCVSKKCDESFTNLDNGNVTCTDGVKFQSQCHFQCEPGYQMVEKYDDYDITSVIVTCGSNGTWSTAQKPHCEKLTCDPNMQYLDDQMEHGKIECTEGSKFQSRCVLTCNHGYEVKRGSYETVCTSTGNWDPNMGICEKITCPPLQANLQSTLECTDQYRFKSQCRVICNSGYQIYDPEKDYNVENGIDCKADGTWCGTPPPCTRIHCPIEFTELEGGEVNCTNDNLYESVCEYKCSAGYEMKQGQVPTSTCTAHEVWSHPVPTCEKRRCPADDSSMKAAQKNGEITCSDENKYDSTCQLNCYIGYELSGEPSTFCNDSGKWSNGIGLCSKISCSELRPGYTSLMQCSEGFKYESRCDFTCKPGFRETDRSMKDGSSQFCQSDGTWEGHDIECEKISCTKRGFETLNNGKVTCNDTNLYMSQCLFECDGGYEMAIKIDEDPASVLVNCTETGQWDVLVPPVCRKVSCSPNPEKMSQGIMNGNVGCTDGDQFQSQCNLQCDVGYEPAEGSDTTICGSNRQWMPTLAECKLVQCFKPEIDENSEVLCTNDFNYKSLCRVQCKEGYEEIFDRNTQGIIKCQSDKSWSGRPVACRKIECDKKALTVTNGKALCTDTNYYGSECEFNCNTGFELKNPGEDVAVCLENKKWNVTDALCKPKTCLSQFSRYGAVICTGNNFNGVCEISCNEGYELVGTMRSKCTDGGNDNMPAKWSPPLGKCQKSRCPVLKEDPNGSYRCHDENKYRSVCRRTCSDGYKMPSEDDYKVFVCQSDLTWSREVPKCQPVQCDSSYLNTDYGSVQASDNYNYGSELTFECPTIGHTWSGMKKIRCLASGVWSAPKPRCERNTCPPIFIPGGNADCNGKRHNDYGSTCTFQCNNLHEHLGAKESKCQLDGTWTNPTPFCKGHCDIKFVNFTNGGVDCSNSYYHHSRCNFWCDSDDNVPIDDSITLFGGNYLTCLETGKWSGVPPCCAKKCPPHGKMDIFLVLDSSSSVGYQNWRKLLAFANQVISNFNIGTDSTLVGAFRYNRDVDTRSEIPIGKYTNLEELTRAIKYMPYGGWGTHTGEALEHVVDYSIRHPSNRPGVLDIVILFTDGMSQDDISVASEKIHANNLTTFVIGIENHLGVLNLQQLSQIASKPASKHITIVRDGFNHLTRGFSDKLGKMVCEYPCLLDQDYRTRTSSYFQYEEESSLSQDQIIEKIKKSAFS